jgi:hypothetical protein
MSIDYHGYTIGTDGPKYYLYLNGAFANSVIAASLSEALDLWGFPADARPTAIPVSDEYHTCEWSFA